MSQHPEKNLPLALREIEDKLAAQPAEGGGNAWDGLVRGCKDGSVNQRFVEPLEKQIYEYIAGLGEADKREIWSQTETGQMNGDDGECWVIGSIEMDLREELLAEMLEEAFRQAEAMKWTSRQRRAEPAS